MLIPDDLTTEYMVGPWGSLWGQGVYVTNDVASTIVEALVVRPAYSKHTIFREVYDELDIALRVSQAIRGDPTEQGKKELVNASAEIVASNTDRRAGVRLKNVGSELAYVRIGTTNASADSYTLKPNEVEVFATQSAIQGFSTVTGTRIDYIGY